MCGCNRCLAALVVVAEDDMEGEVKNTRHPSFPPAQCSAGLRFIMSRLGASAAAKPSTSDEKQQQKLLWCAAAGETFVRCEPHAHACSYFYIMSRLYHCRVCNPLPLRS